MKSFVEKNKLIVILMMIFIISEIIVNPIGNFPLNDDWTYGKSVLIYQKDNIINIGDFPAMTLYTQIIWGALFTKIFGFSFTVLRFSTLISALISVLTLNKIVIDITNNRLTAFILCLVFLFNPIYFGLCNTFMTDVNFNTLIIVSCYFAFEFFRSRSYLSFIAVFILSMLIVLLRQYGIIVPACFTFCCLFLDQKRWLYVGLSIAFFAIIIVVFKYYEHYLKGILLPDSAYKFSGDHLSPSIFFDRLFLNLKTRSSTIILHVLLYLFPFAVIYISGLLKEFKGYVIVLTTLICSAAIYFILREERFPIGNTFSNLFIGAETFVQDMNRDYKGEHEHNYSETADKIGVVIKYLFTSGSLICFVLFVFKLIKQRINPFNKNPKVIFIATLFLAYIFMILITESYYDRYHIPLITLALIVFAYANLNYKTNYRLAILPLLLFVYISVFGTKDYLELNRKRWEAYAFLKDKVGVEYHKINGGMEVNGWHEGNRSIWYYFLDLYAYDYVIQYDKPKDFKLVREYEFQRYLPYTKDKISIFVNERKKRQKND